MTLFRLDKLRVAHTLVNKTVPPTPSYCWPLLQQRLKTKVWVKHENHTPTGAFKARGGLVYMNNIERHAQGCAGVVSATRGNHGQSIALAAQRKNMRAVIVVPENNSLEKNAAMEAFGCELVIAGKDFDESRKIAADIGREQNLHMIPSFHEDLVLGVATYGLELFETVPDLDTVYVPIGMGSGICALITVRDLLGLKTEIVGVVSSHAPAYQKSFEQNQIVTTATANTFADGMACRDPNPEALEIIKAGAARVISVNDREIADAMRIYFSDTHNVTEGAGAASLAGLIQEETQQKNKNVAVIMTGGNIDTDKYQQVLAGLIPNA